MSHGDEWAHEGRKIARKAYAQRDPNQSSEVALPLQASSPEIAAEKFKIYVKAFELADEDFEEGKSICVIGAADNALAAEAKRRGKRAFVMGVDPKEKRYQQLDSAIINHDARELGFPSDFEGFDLVLSLDAVPKYFFLWGAKDENKDEVINSGSDVFDYSIADRKTSKEEIEEAIYTAISEMLRITKPGGKVKMRPFPVKVGSMPSLNEVLMVRVIERLSAIYPGLQPFLTIDETLLWSARPGDSLQATLEIIRPLVKQEGSDTVNA